MRSADVVILTMGAIIGILLAVIFWCRHRVHVLDTAYANELAKLQQIIDDKTKSSAAQRSTIKGQLAEQMYPLSDRCPYLLSDMRFMGMPVDYIIFDGYTECKDGGGQFREVIFGEVKSGSSQLSRHQRAIRDAINEGRVRWENINIS